MDYPFLIHSDREFKFGEVIGQKSVDLSNVKSGDVVALIGDFNSQSILTLLQLIDKKAILVPLTIDTKLQHKYFFETALVDVIIEGSSVKRLIQNKNHHLINELRKKKSCWFDSFFNWHNRSSEGNFT